jgi:hypothetical protein
MLRLAPAELLLLQTPNPAIFGNQATWHQELAPRLLSQTIQAECKILSCHRYSLEGWLEALQRPFQSVDYKFKQKKVCLKMLLHTYRHGILGSYVDFCLSTFTLCL